MTNTTLCGDQGDKERNSEQTTMINGDLVSFCANVLNKINQGPQKIKDTNEGTDVLWVPKSNSILTTFIEQTICLQNKK